ncbi:MAG: WD40/YVTN/BNR-like repeat-containing protein [Actinomycetota bacterium]
MTIADKTRLRWALAAVMAGVLVGLTVRNGPSPTWTVLPQGALELEAEEVPGDAFLFSRFGPDKAPSPRVLRAAARQARAISRQTARSAPDLAAPRWRFLGPANIGARVVDIAVDVELKDTIYVASASGGIWKSTDGGSTYVEAWPHTWVQSMGAIAMGRDGTLWVGTGETNPGGGSLTYGGNGVYKSTNRAKTWKRVGLTSSPTIGRIAVDPKDPRHVLVAASGNLFKAGGQRGLYETRDSGATWKLILKPPNDTTGAVDVAFDPKNPKNILVAMWDHFRYPDWRDYTGPGSGIWQSSDGGKNFTLLGPSNGLPPQNEAIGRIGVAIAPSNPGRMYAIYANNPTGTHELFFVSSDGGATWTAPPQAQATLAAVPLTYGWWFGRVWVDPKDENRLFVAGLPLAESTNGGQSFTSQGGMHVDQHALAWDPHVKNRVWAGNDGGVYTSTQNAANGSWVLAKYQPWNQFYTIDVSEQDPLRINGGLQDQGNVRTWPEGTWNFYGSGGDGVKNAINPKDKEHVFSCTQYGACAVSFNGGNQGESIDAETFSTRQGWMTPIEFAPHDPQVVFTAGDYVSRSEDGGRNWRPISYDLGRAEAGREINPLYAGHYGTVQAIGLNKAQPETVYAGTDNGYLYKTTNLAVWTPLTNEALPDRWITSIEVQPDNPDVFYITFSGYREGDNKSYVLKSTDGGGSFKNITGNLPKAPVNEVILVGESLFVATDLGVFTSTTAGGKWYRLGQGLPNAPVPDIRYIPKNDSLYAGTFGRGVYTVKLP